MNYPTETEHEAMGQRQRTEDQGKVIFASVLFFCCHTSHIEACTLKTVDDEAFCGRVGTFR